jgi:TIR domain
MALQTRLYKSSTVRLFYSYADEDERLFARVIAHLSPLRREGAIDEWHHRDEMPGGELDGEIESRMEGADIILLLISADFFNSGRCWRDTVRAMERREHDEVTVAPVILRPVDWRKTPFSQLVALPRDGKPITTWDNEDEALLNVALGIRKVVTRRLLAIHAEDEPAHAEWPKAVS